MFGQFGGAAARRSTPDRSAVLEGETLFESIGDAKELRGLLCEIQPGALLFLHLFEGTNSPPEVRELGKFLLDCL